MMGFLISVQVDPQENYGRQICRPRLLAKLEVTLPEGEFINFHHRGVTVHIIADNNAPACRASGVPGPRDRSPARC